MNRIHDPYGIVPGDLLIRSQKKIEDALFVLSAHPKNNGNPLLFAYTVGKSHILDARNPKQFKTAATNGKNFFWYPHFLDKLSGLQAVAVLKHEAYHNLLFHPEQMREVSKPRLFNLAIDFIVNSLIEREYRTSSISKNFESKEHQIWKAPLGIPITFEEFKKILVEDLEKLRQKLKEIVERAKAGDKAEPLPPELDQACTSKDLEDPTDVQLKYALVDESVLNRTGMQLYKELLTIYNGYDDEFLGFIEEHFSMDSHYPSERTKQDALAEALRCVGFAKQMRGIIPGEVQSELNELTDPTLDLREFTEQTIQKHKRDGGKRASYTNFKRRFLTSEKYYPKYYTSVSQILVLLDTSGSMSDQDIAVGVSELKQFIGKANIYIVPTDAEPHWDSITKVCQMTDMQNIKVIGRGGTMFTTFFKEYREKLRQYGNFNAIIVISDGYTDIIPIENTPNCDVGWVITSPSEFKQPFGKAIYLKREAQQN